MAARFEIICTDVLGLACKGATILEINKRTMNIIYIIIGFSINVQVQGQHPH